jgi:hypothetical protein
MQGKPMLGVEFLNLLDDAIMAHPERFAGDPARKIACPHCGFATPASELKTVSAPDREPPAELLALLTAPMPDSPAELDALTARLMDGLMGEIIAVRFLCPGCECPFPFKSAAKVEGTCG